MRMPRGAIRAFVLALTGDMIAHTLRAAAVAFYEIGH